MPADSEVAAGRGARGRWRTTRAVLRLASGCAPDATVAVLESRTLRSTPESSNRSGYDGVKRKRGSEVHAAVDPLGHLPALCVALTDEQDRAHVGELAAAFREATGERVELDYVDQGYTGEKPAAEVEVCGTSGWRRPRARSPSEASCCCRVGGCWSAVPAPTIARNSLLESCNRIPLTHVVSFRLIDSVEHPE